MQPVKFNVLCFSRLSPTFSSSAFTLSNVMAGAVNVQVPGNTRPEMVSVAAAALPMGSDSARRVNEGNSKRFIGHSRRSVDRWAGASQLG